MGYESYKEQLTEQDPDVVVDILGLTSRQIVEGFEEQVEELYRREEIDEENLPWD